MPAQQTDHPVCVWMSFGQTDDLFLLSPQKRGRQEGRGQLRHKTRASREEATRLGRVSVDELTQKPRRSLLSQAGSLLCMPERPDTQCAILHATTNLGLRVEREKYKKILAYWLPSSPWWRIWEEWPGSTRWRSILTDSKVFGVQSIRQAECVVVQSATKQYERQ